MLFGGLCGVTFFVMLCYCAVGCGVAVVLLCCCLVCVVLLLHVVLLLCGIPCCYCIVFFTMLCYCVVLCCCVIVCYHVCIVLYYCFVTCLVIVLLCCIHMLFVLVCYYCDTHKLFWGTLTQYISVDSEGPGCVFLSFSKDQTRCRIPAVFKRVQSPATETW